MTSAWDANLWCGSLWIGRGCDLCVWDADLWCGSLWMGRVRDLSVCGMETFGVGLYYGSTSVSISLPSDTPLNPPRHKSRVSSVRQLPLLFDVSKFREHPFHPLLPLLYCRIKRGRWGGGRRFSVFWNPG